MHHDLFKDILRSCLAIHTIRYERHSASVFFSFIADPPFLSSDMIQLCRLCTCLSVALYLHSDNTIEPPSFPINAILSMQTFVQKHTRLCRLDSRPPRTFRITIESSAISVQVPAAHSHTHTHSVGKILARSLVHSLVRSFGERDAYACMRAAHKHFSLHTRACRLRIASRVPRAPPNGPSIAQSPLKTCVEMSVRISFLLHRVQARS